MADTPARPLTSGEATIRLARRRQLTTDLALLLVVLSILALALVPFVNRERVASIESRVRDVLEPAQRELAEYTATQVRGMAQVQSFLLSTGPLQRQRHRESYAQLRLAGDSILEVLEAVAAPLGLEAELQALEDASTDWHLSHVQVLSGVVSRDEFDASGELSLYETLLEASRVAREGLFSRLDEARRDVATARTQQLAVTWLLLAIALVAALGLSYIARRLRLLTQESEGRRRAADTARREADAVLAGTADGVLGLDLEGRCIFLNRAGADLLGRAPSDLLGKHVHDIVMHSRADGSRFPTQDSPLTRVLEYGEMGFTSDEVFWRSDGTSLPVRLSSRPMMDGGRVRGAVLSFVDLTQIREVEARLRKALRARDEVVSVVSHDLRNPVGTIYIAADLLLAVPLPEEKRSEHLTVIKRQAKQMEILIKDLLDVSRIEAGTLPVRPEKDDVGLLLADVVEQIGPLSRSRRLNFVQRVEAGLPPVSADRTRVLQVLWNLLGNAAKFTPDGGDVTVGAAQDGEMVRVFVRDSGPGIDPDDQPHVFDRFWQVRRSDREGVGLGLAIVKGIVEAHGGEVGVESTLGHGSTFWFTLPLWNDDGEGEGGGDAPARKQPAAASRATGRVVAPVVDR